MNLKSGLTLFIGGIGIAWYFVSLFTIGMQLSSAPANGAFREFMSLSITTIGVALSTFIGMLLGFRVVSGEVKEVRSGTSNSMASESSKRLDEVIETTVGSTLQWTVAMLYVGSLLLALYFWWLHGDQSDPSIVNLGKSLLGLVAGALSVLLNLPR